jgi:5-oxoprolinase (ATP-hydrolysing)
VLPTPIQLPDAVLSPKIFGPHEDQPLDVDVVRQQFEALADQISTESGVQKTPESVALGFLAVATEAMCNPIRTLSEARGHETSSHWLAVFGGAGGQSGCDVAATLAITRVVIHKCSAILSAFGIAKADVVHESQAAFSGTFDNSTETDIRRRLDDLRKLSEKALIEQGHSQASLSSSLYCNMRYEGADAMLMVREPKDGDFTAAFKAKHHQDFGFSLENRAVIVDDLRARVVAAGEDPKEKAAQIPLARQIEEARAHPRTASTLEHSQVCFESTGWVSTGIYKLYDLEPNTVIRGPAMIIDATQTIMIVPDAEAVVLRDHVVIDLDQQDKQVDAKLVVDPILVRLIVPTKTDLRSCRSSVIVSWPLLIRWVESSRRRPSPSTSRNASTSRVLYSLPRVSIGFPEISEADE